MLFSAIRRRGCIYYTLFHLLTFNYKYVVYMPQVKYTILPSVQYSTTKEERKELRSPIENPKRRKHNIEQGVKFLLSS